MAERVRNAQRAMRAYLEKKGEDYELETHRKLAEELNQACAVYLEMLGDTGSHC